MDELLRLLRSKSETLNLFSAGDREKLAEKHAPDALAVEDFWITAPGQTVMDLGTGGGIPGLVLAVQHPELSFLLVDAREKKVRAVQEVADEAGLSNVRTVSGRFEDLAHQAKHRQRYPIVLARAVAPLPTLLEYAGGFLQPGGRLYAWKGPDYEAELADSLAAQKILDLHFESSHSYSLPGGEFRVILSFVKGSRLNSTYPRHPDLPKSKPL